MRTLYPHPDPPPEKRGRERWSFVEFVER